MEVLGGIQSFLLEKFVPFIILLGLLIFVHELGHFLVAKFFKVRVEVFSLGFGKKILQFVRGPTTYCISLIPLGGYVKMFGDDPSAQIPEHEKHEAFTHKKVGQRIAIVLAGPLMNFFFAILLFVGVGLNGEKTIGTQLGDVDMNSPAGAAGFRSGDKILSVDGQPVTTWKDIKELLETERVQEFRFQVERAGGGVEIAASTERVKNPDVLQWQDDIHHIEGLSPLALVSYVGVPETNSPAHQAGIRSLDQVTSVNGREIKTWYELEEAIFGLKGQDSASLQLKRPGEGEQTEDLTVNLPLGGVRSWTSGAQVMSDLGLESTELYISHISEGMPAHKVGIQRGDKILSIDGKRMNKWQEVLEAVNGFDPQAGALKFNLLRDGHPRVIAVTPKENSVMTEQGQEETRYQIGIGPALYQTVAYPIVYKAPNMVEAFRFGWEQTIEWSQTIVVSFVKMLQNKVSPKNIGGIFTIGQVASETFKLGLSPYLKIMAVISINLFILNLLPIPVLDGGHLVFFLVEALRGAPLSIKKMEVAQQIGLIILISLMAFALFNDISRLW